MIKNENIFLVGNILREVKNGRLNCNNAKNEQFTNDAANGTYVKKIRRGNEIFPYASTQNQKKVIKDFARSQGFSISSVRSINSKSATNEGNPYKNYDEDIMGFMNAEALTLTAEEYEELDEKDKIGFKKKGKKGYAKNITKKRRAKLMMTPLQAIGNTKITSEFSTRQTDDTSLLYTKEVYSTDMSSAFILDVDGLGRFNANDRESAYRDYNLEEAEAILETPIEEKEMNFEINVEERISRVNVTLDALRVLNSRITMTNNLEDLSAKFIIMANYNVGSSIFNNIFENSELKIDYLKQAIEENEQYRISKVYIGCREQFFRQDDHYLLELLRLSFENDDRFIIGGVKEVIDIYKRDLKNMIV